MIYTVKLDIFIDGDEIISDEVLISALKEVLRSGNIELEDGYVLDVND